MYTWKIYDKIVLITKSKIQARDALLNRNGYKKNFKRKLKFMGQALGLRWKLHKNISVQIIDNQNLQNSSLYKRRGV